LSLDRNAGRELLRQYAARLPDEGFAVELVFGAGGTPYDALVVDLVDLKADEVRWRLEIAVLPPFEVGLERSHVLQLFVPMADTVADGAAPELLRAIAQVNTLLPLGGFGLIEQRALLYYKCNQVMPDDEREVSYRSTLESVHLIQGMLNTLADTLLAVAEGRRSARDALAENPFAAVYDRSLRKG